MYGTANKTKWDRSRWSVIGRIEQSHSGNVILRVGRLRDDGEGWVQSEHLVLTPAEAVDVARELLNRAGCGAAVSSDCA